MTNLSFLENKKFRMSSPYTKIVDKNVFRKNVGIHIIRCRKNVIFKLENPGILC